MTTNIGPWRALWASPDPHGSRARGAWYVVRSIDVDKTEWLRDDAGRALRFKDEESAVHATGALLVGRGGAGRGQGRKLGPEGERLEVVAIRLSPAQRAKLHELGGSEWIRDRINRASLVKK